MLCREMSFHWDKAAANMDLSETNHVKLILVLFFTVICGQGLIVDMKEHDLSKILIGFWESSVKLSWEACS